MRFEIKQAKEHIFLIANQKKHLIATPLKQKTSGSFLANIDIYIALEMIYNYCKETGENYDGIFRQKPLYSKGITKSFCN